MTCTPNHLLIELGVSRRELGHFIMEGRDNMTSPDIQERARAAKIMVEVAAENLRLRAVNAKLLVTMEAVMESLPNHELPSHTGHYCREASPCLNCQARDAIEEARK